MGAKQVSLCVALRGYVFRSNAVALHARISSRRGAQTKTAPKNAQSTVSTTPIIPPFMVTNNTLTSFNAFLPTQALRFVVYIVQIEPNISTQLGMATISFSLTPRPDGFLGHNAQRVYPDPGPHQLWKPETRWSLCVFSYATYEGACKSITYAKEYISNKSPNLLNLNLEAAGFVKIVATICNW